MFFSILLLSEFTPRARSASARCSASSMASSVKGITMRHDGRRCVLARHAPIRCPALPRSLAGADDQCHGQFDRIRAYPQPAQRRALAAMDIPVIPVRRWSSRIVTKDKTQQQIDEILDKISQSGYDCLTKEEKEFLFKAGK